MKTVTITLTDAEAKHVEKVLANRPKTDAVAIRVAYELKGAPRREARRKR